MCPKLASTLLLLLISPISLPAAETAPARSLTVWLIPAEPPDYASPLVGSSVIEQIEVFNQQYGKASPVTVLNTTVPLLLDQLVAWNPDYAVPSWRIIKGQMRTLATLDRFAAAHQAHINVRFVTWSKMFDDLRAAAADRLAGSPASAYAPDVVQVGSTWVAWLAQQGYLLPADPSLPAGAADGLQWRELKDVPQLPYIPKASLRFTTDVRLLFYWKRRQNEPPTAPEFRLDASNWEALIASLKSRVLASVAGPSQPMVMPIGLSQNLLHDYIPLIWATGGDFLTAGSSRVELTVPQALTVPMLIASSALLSDAGQQPRRVIAFPENRHDEAAQYFIRGEYCATIEPVDFIKRWHTQSQSGQSREQLVPQLGPAFWAYAGVAVPPTPFKGGSDLIVVRGAPQPTLAFALMRALAFADQDYTRALAELGFLPAHRADAGIEDLLKTLGDASEAELSEGAREGLAQFAAAVRQVREQGREYPAAVSWPTELESRDVLESFQRLWRRIGEWDEKGASRARIEEAAAEAGLTINRRINWWTKFWWQWREPLILIFILGAAIGGIAYLRIRHIRERAKVLDRIRRLRGFASSALYAVYSTHAMISTQNYPPAYQRLVRTNKAAAEKALVVAAGLHGWRRGRDERNWADTPLTTVVWRAIILAVEFCHQPELFKQWEQAGEPEAAAFLRAQGLMRAQPPPDEELPPFHFHVACPADVPVTMPFLLEQALVCLLQNAITASWIKGAGCASITVTYDAGNNAVEVLNQGDPLAPELCAAINHSRSIEEFQTRIDTLLKSETEQKPGIGLVEAYSIATQCYGGLRVDEAQPKFSLRLQPVKRGGEV